MTTLKWKKTGANEWTTINGYQIKMRTEHTPLGDYRLYTIYKDGEKVDTREHSYLKRAKLEVDFLCSGMSYLEWSIDRDAWF